MTTFENGTSLHFPSAEPNLWDTWWLLTPVEWVSSVCSKLTINSPQAGKVFVDGKVVYKAGTPVSDKAVVEIKAEIPKYVCRWLSKTKSFAY